MQRAIELASLGAGYTSPNPMVGAVIVHDDKIIGEGYHKQYGQAHAEVNAINSVLTDYDNAADLLKESTLYVSLEPCAHFGKTPPCADLIIRHSIPWVVIASPDPFDQVDGKGTAKLRQAGIQVTENFLRREADFLNRRFLTRITQQRPYFILKWAQTANGYFAPDNGAQQWISGAQSRVLVHKWRAEESAVLIGKGTALADDPQLNTRYWKGPSPLRIVIDRNLSLPEDLHIFDGSQDCIVFNAVRTEVRGRIKYIWLENFDQYLPQMIAFQLYLMDVQSVIVEGGAQILDIFIRAGMWDEARVISARHNWVSGIPAPVLHGSISEEFSSGEDRVAVYFNTQNPAGRA